jgi:hypothetical protein
MSDKKTQVVEIIGIVSAIIGLIRSLFGDKRGKENGRCNNHHSGDCDSAVNKVE